MRNFYFDILSVEGKIFLFHHSLLLFAHIFSQIIENVLETSVLPSDVAANIITDGAANVGGGGQESGQEDQQSLYPLEVKVKMVTEVTAGW